MQHTSLREIDFASAFLQETPHLRLGVQKYNFIDELETLAGIPDAVGIRSDQYELLHDFRTRWSIDFTNGHAKIISKLNHWRLVDEDTALSLTGMNRDYFYKNLNSLEKEGVIERGWNGGLRLASDFVLPKVEILSIEFKLNAWKSALRQAMRHKTFSTKVCVVMPADKESVLVKNQDIFDRMNVGAGVFDNDKKTIKYIVKPRRSMPTARRFYIDTLGRIPLKKN